MSLADVLVWVLRIFGALYLLGGLYVARQMWFWGRIGPSMNKLAQVTEDFRAETEGRAPRHQQIEDTGRNWWIFSGALALAVAGASMIMAHRSAPWLLALVVVHQLFYFIRQRRRELAARTPEAAAEVRPQRSTINGFFAGLVMMVMAAWLGYAGALN